MKICMKTSTTLNYWRDQYSFTLLLSISWADNHIIFDIRFHGSILTFYYLRKDNYKYGITFTYIISLNDKGNII